MSPEPTETDLITLIGSTPSYVGVLPVQGSEYSACIARRFYSGSPSLLRFRIRREFRTNWDRFGAESQLRSRLLPCCSRRSLLCPHTWPRSAQAKTPYLAPARVDPLPRCPDVRATQVDRRVPSQSPRGMGCNR